MSKTDDREMIMAALLGYRTAANNLLRKIAECEMSLRPRRTVSAAGRRNIAAGQRKRWASYRRAKRVAA